MSMTFIPGTTAGLSRTVFHFPDGSVGPGKWNSAMQQVEPDDNGEGPVDENEAKRRAKEVLARPEHRKPKGSPEDRATEDDAVEGEDE